MITYNEHVYWRHEMQYAKMKSYNVDKHDRANSEIEPHIYYK
jgi:hypothetical protein